MRNQKNNGLNGPKAILIVLAFLAEVYVEKTPYVISATLQMNAISAGLCQTLTQGLGIPLERMGARIKSVNHQPPFQIDFDDGGWILKQYFLLAPIVLSIGWIFKKALWQMVLAGILTTTLCICTRAALLGISAATWGAPFATGAFDTFLRYGQMVFILLALMTFATRPRGTTEKIEG